MWDRYGRNYRLGQSLGNPSIKYWTNSCYFLRFQTVVGFISEEIFCTVINSAVILGRIIQTFGKGWKKWQFLTARAKTSTKPWEGAQILWSERSACVALGLVSQQECFGLNIWDYFSFFSESHLVDMLASTLIGLSRII